MKQAGWNLNNSYVTLPDKFYWETEPGKVESPKLITFNSKLATSLGFHAEELKSDGVEIFAGNELPPESSPISQAYAGHQFGNFTMLGDGRAVLLGEQITPAGDRLDIQLKGSGRTPYSRGGDGRATLGPMLREYIISEAMHGLGIPTTRSLAVVTTGEDVFREKPLPGAILTRVASSHIRVGTFEYAANFRTKEELQKLADYTIERHYPEVVEAENPYVGLLDAVIKRQATLIAQWQLVGFIHGVMNTDNMTISGETIDYGPCAFIDEYDPETVFSSIDRNGRYAYKNQPAIGMWNLARFAETLLPLIHDDEDQAIEMAKERLSIFSDIFQEQFLNGMRAKLGIVDAEENDRVLIGNLLKLMEKYNADYTNTFRALTLGEIEDTDIMEKEDFRKWYEEWKRKIKGIEEEARTLMRKSNPAVIPRNHRVEEALDAAVEKGDFSVMERLLAVLEDPYAYRPEQEAYAAPPEPTEIPYQTFCGT